MSKNEKGRPASEKTLFFRIVTIMLSFPKIGEKCCDANFLSVYEKYLGISIVFLIYTYFMLTKKSPKLPKQFHCDTCDYKCSKESDFNKHLATRKHKTAYIGLQNSPENSPQHSPSHIPEKTYDCVKCAKKYVFRQSLYNHNKKCKGEVNGKKAEDEIKSLSNIVIELIKSNTDLQKQMMEVCKNSSINNNTINSHNKTFNLQFFLNEQCKDAMNLMDFVDSMTLEFSDLEEVGKLGYVEGISNIIIRKLNALDIYKRPIHCSDGKREIMYVRDENVWGKENSTYDKLRKAIKRVTYKNGAMLVPWSKEHPQCMNNQHHLNDVYVQMMGQAMGGKEEFVDSENKIMKKIAKAVLIEKA